MKPSSPFPEPDPEFGSKPTDPLAYLAQVLAVADEDIDLGHAALAVATAHYVDLDVAAYLERLDGLAEEARRRIGRVRRPEKIIAAINAYLFDELGFRGNREEYYDPSNSFLNEVIDRRAGLPITLSILYAAIGRRLALPIVGVGLPLHFIVKFVTGDREIYVDPFHRGEILTAAACQDRVEHIIGSPIVFEPAYLDETPIRLILYRLLNNLKQVYMRRDQPGPAGRVVEQMLVVAPDSHENVRDRGLLYLQENALTLGAEWMLRYLERAPDAGDADRVRSQIARAYRRRGAHN